MAINFYQTGLAALFGSALLLTNIGHAAAVKFENRWDAVTINYNGNIKETDVRGLTAATTFTLTAINSNTLSFDITIKNTSDTSLWSSSRISAIGFNTDPNISSALITSPSNWFAVLDGKFPNGFGDIDICFKEDGGEKNCTGNGSGGISLGETLELKVELTFLGNPPPVNFDNFGVRYQSLTSKGLIDGKKYSDTSGTGKGTPGTDNPTLPAEIPEPASLLLFGAGLLGFGLNRRRKQA